MYKINYSHYNPFANEASVIQGDTYRISLLTPFLVRLEYSTRGVFEDGQTKMVLNRKFESVDYRIFETKNSLKIMTEGLTIRYNKQPFSSYGLNIELNGKQPHPYRGIWHFGDKLRNLGGTARTLDFLDGAAELEPGLMAREGISYIDDSDSPIILPNGWYKKRDSNDIDLYIFGYKNNYHECLRDYYRLTGSQPKLPRYALGNWWSRYHKYNEKSYIDLMVKFQNLNIPFSVAVIDMDWHLTEVPDIYGTSWTGYTWNRNLFPNPNRFLKKLKSLGMAITLNIHPHSGIRPFEEQYLPMAKHLGIDYKNKETIDFNPSSQAFLEIIFEYIYYPYEEIGVDFWWIDWQQGPTEIDPNYDSLWVLNHYHYNDNQKDNNLGITFSRYSGPGSHRYPIGFSGDTVISWDSLEFQPYFTATASNIGYGWWSHDIGGHRHGYRDDELMVRWLQFGVFSPINRLHSADSEFLVKEPWNFKQPYQEIMINYLRLRHKLLPYLYSENVRIFEEKTVLILPMYYNHSANEESYEVPNQYYFGSELIVCPITNPANKQSLNANFKAWLPEGKWIDIKTGLSYEGNKRIVLYRPVEEIPVFLKEGGIIPLANLSHLSAINSIENPEHIELLIAANGTGSYELYEDEIGFEATKDYAKTKFIYDNEASVFYINSAMGNTNAIPEVRSWHLIFYSLVSEKIDIYINDTQINSYDYKIDLKNNKTRVRINDIPTDSRITIKFQKLYKIDWQPLKKNLIHNYLLNAQIDNQIKKKIASFLENSFTEKELLANLSSLSIEPELLGPIFEVILA